LLKFGAVLIGGHPKPYVALDTTKGHRFEGSMSSLKLLVAFALLLVAITTAPERNGEMPREWLIERLSVAEAEARFTLPPDDRAERYPDLKKPFGFKNAEWEKLKRQMQPADELWIWEKRPWPGAGGIALMRNRDLVGVIMTWIH
jgi:hypothetical protein